MTQIPVTVISGYLGAGKTTLINHLLTNQQGHQIAVIVNDMGEINIDADLIARKSDDEGIIDLSNGCICCRLQGDLLEEAERLADAREFDYLLVEASGISEPIPIAQVFLEGTEASEADPTERFRLDTMVTVLDTYGFWKEFDAGESLPEHVEEDDSRPLSEVLVESIEFCDVLLLNKCDMVPEDVLEEIEAVIAELQPTAKRIRTTYSEVDPERVLDTGRFDYEQARRAPGWKRQLAAHGRGEADTAHEHADDHGHDHDHSQADRHGVTSFVYSESRVFHPERLAAWLEEWDGSIIRAKGVASVAGTDDVIGVSQAGPSVQAGPIGEWGPEDDRRTQLVFIGQELDEQQIRAELEACLLEGTEAKPGDVEAFPL